MIFCILLFNFWMMTGCTHLFYQPTRVMYAQSLNELDADREDIRFLTADGVQLFAWFFKSRKQEIKGTVVQFHGNAENMTSHFASLFWMVQEGYHLFTFDYRGYGLSKSQPSQEGLYKDALAAIRYVLDHKNLPLQSERKIILWGQSLGGAVLMRAFPDLLAKDREQIQAVVIESSFHNYCELARNFLSRSWLTYLFQPIATGFISNQYSPENQIAQIAPTPLLVIHGDADRVVPLSFGQKIYELGREPKKIWVIPGGGHINAMDINHGKNRPKLLEFLKES